MHFLLFGVALLSFLAAERPVTISSVRSGHAKLIQEGRLTLLDLSLPNNTAYELIPLTHPSDYRQSTAPPYEAKLIAESPSHFVIFTDTFVSNPGNVQGQCGANLTGERFVHVVALGPHPHETLSALIESCLLDIEPTEDSPNWLPKIDSAGFVGKLTLTLESNHGSPRPYTMFQQTVRSLGQAPTDNP